MNVKNKKDRSNKIVSFVRERKLVVSVLLFGLVGTAFIVSSFAATPGSTAARCRPPSNTDSKNAPVSTVPACVNVGSTGAITYWQDNFFPNKKVHVTRVDLNNSGLVVRASGFDERGITPTEFAKKSGSKVVINGDFFYKDNNYITNGIAIGSGGLWPFTKDNKTSTFIACTNQRDCMIDDYNTEVKLDPKVYTSAVSGSEILLTPTFQWHLKPGEPGCGTVEHTCSSPHPRTGVALSADRKIMWMVVVEGRQTNLSGLSLYDFTQLFKALGATWAINLDGGGSSGMVINNNLVNKRPSDDLIERKVGNSLGIVELPKGVTK